MATTEVTEAKERQKKVWNQFSGGWKKWDDLTMDISRPAGDEMIRLLNLEGNETVLDVACGTGEPGLTIAKILRQGKVTGMDQAEKMGAIALEKAEEYQVNNYNTVIGDLTSLPFKDNSFDAVTCRYGFMFFADMKKVAEEIRRVLKPSGKIAVAVWDVPEKNPWVTIIMGTILEILHNQLPASNGPGMFRCAQREMMPKLLSEAGFTHIIEREVAAKLNCGDGQTYWNFMNDVGAAVVVALQEASPQQREEIKSEVIHKIEGRYPGKDIAIDASSWVVYGEKK